MQTQAVRTTLNSFHYAQQSSILRPLSTLRRVHEQRNDRPSPASPQYDKLDSSVKLVVSFIPSKYNQY